jgi:myo-inositol 2-dehydrogenase / D-chiro-inositol 1-dehydrogenase
MSDRAGKATFQAPSRRQFLRTSAGAVSMAAVGGLSLARGAHAAGSDTLKIGLIGCGGRGRGAANEALGADPNTKLVALADVFEDHAKAARKILQSHRPTQVAVDDEHCFTGLDAYRKVIESGVDVVLIACASKFHPEYLQAAIAAGKHVFVEKPHAIDPPGIRTVIAACDEARKKNLNVVSGLCWRYDPAVSETMKRVLDGAIGDIVAIQETYMRSTYRQVEPNPSESELEYQFRNWYHFYWLSGDDVPQSLLHSIDKGAWAMHDGPPLKAHGQGGRAAAPARAAGDVFDHLSVVFEYPNGVRMYANCRAEDGCYGEVSDTFLGTKGRCYITDRRCQIEGATKWRYRGARANKYQVEHQRLFAAIRAGTPINNGSYMVNSSMMVVLGQMVAYTGRQIAWDEVMSSTHRAGPEPAKCRMDMEPPVKPDARGVYPVPIPGVTRFP